MTAINRPPRRLPRLSAAPIPPQKANPRPPIRAATTIRGASRVSAPREMAMIGASRARGAPVVIHWAAHLTKATASRGAGPRARRSRAPSS